MRNIITRIYIEWILNLLEAVLELLVTARLKDEALKIKQVMDDLKK